MKLIQSIFDFFERINKKEFFQLLILVLIILSTLCGILIYRYYSTSNWLIKQIRLTNFMRSEVKELFKRNLDVKKQKDKVDEILDKDKDFKLMHYFNNIIKQHRLNPYVKDKQISISDIDSNQDYVEIKLTATIKNINMKQLVDLLETIESSDRVFTKKLDITKPEKIPSIDVELLIATLQSKSE